MAKSFARAGCSRIAITDINPKTLQKTKDGVLNVNKSVEVFERAGDISDEQFVDQFMDDAFSKFSRLDYAVNCAGVLGNKTIKAVEMPMQDFDRLSNINHRGTWLSCRAQLRNMLKQDPLSEHPQQRGSIVSIASQLGIVARPGAGMIPLCSHAKQYRTYTLHSCILCLKSGCDQHDAVKCYRLF